MNDRVRVAEGVGGTIVVLEAWCPRCKALVLPSDTGFCTWGCGTQIIDEDTLPAREMLEQLRAGGLDPAGPVPDAPAKVERPRRASRSRTNPWTREELVAAIRRWADEHDGMPPTATQWNVCPGVGWPNVSACVRVFGKWSAALLAAGFEPGVRRAERRLKIASPAADVSLPAPPRSRVYVSGPMTGLEEFNFPAFKATTARLRAAGFDVVCPSEISVTLPAGSSWGDYLRADLRALLECDTVVILDDAIKSRGARLECHVAIELGIPLLTVDELLERAAA